MTIHGKPEGVYRRYTHGDQAPRYVIIDPKAGKDWEFGGWYPEYWEYTRALKAPRPYWD
jgi:hypothetical protein